MLTVHGTSSPARVSPSKLSTRLKPNRQEPRAQLRPPLLMRAAPRIVTTFLLISAGLAISAFAAPPIEIETLTPPEAKRFEVEVQVPRIASPTSAQIRINAANTSEAHQSAGWAETGRAPKTENDDVFSLDGKNLVVVFPPYQIAPYSSGTIEAKIPVQALTATTAPEGPLAGR